MNYCTLIENTSEADYFLLNLSAEQMEKANVSPENHHELAEYIKHQASVFQAKYGVGGYLEKRNLYANSSLFNNAEKRNIHLGIDVWAPANTPICSPLSGKVVTSYFNKGEGNYGGTIILEHTNNQTTFFTLFGHLSKASLTHNPIHKHIRANQAFCVLGKPSENGGYLPHLHYQIILDRLNYTDDFPGVCSENQIENFSKICPNPIHFLNFYNR